MANSNTTELFEALTLLAKEKGIDPAVLIEKIQTALVIAIKKEYPRSKPDLDGGGKDPHPQKAGIRRYCSDKAGYTAFRQNCRTDGKAGHQAGP